MNLKTYSKNKSPDQIKLRAYQQLFKLSSEAFVLIDENGNISDCNPYFETITGYSLGELREISIFHITPKDYWDEEKKIIKDILKTYHDPVTIEKLIITKKGIRKNIIC